MTYVGQFVDGDLDDAAEWNTLFPICLLRTTTSQTLTNSATTYLSFGASSTVRDPLGWHDETTNNSRITVSLAGMYRLTAQVSCSNDMGTGGYIEFRKNGTTVLVREANDWRQSTNTAGGLAHVCLLAANDYIEIGVRNSSATNRTRNLSGFSAHYLGA